jgi:predicted transposase/invertase (TIGR01784 family)
MCIRDRLSELMQLFASLRTEDPAFPALSQRIQQYKVEEEGVRHMSELIEAYAYEKEMRGIEKGREEGHKEEKYTMIRNAFKAGVPVETIAQFAKLSEQEVREIIMGA